MSASLYDSIVRVTSGKPRESSFGTGFVFYRDDQGTYVLTCAHVVNDVGGPETVKAGRIAATVVAPGSEADIDLAVLRVEGLQDRPLLHLSVSGQTGNNFTTTGFQKYSKQYIAVSLEGILGELVGVEASDNPELLEAWYLKIIGEQQLQPGYSGSPVVDKESGQVIAVVSHRQDEGKKGLAISIKALKEIWHDIPDTLLQEAEPATTPTSTNEAGDIQREVQTQGSTAELLTQEEREKLINRLCKLPGIEYANVRHSLVSTLPAKFQSNIEFKNSVEVHITEIVNIVISDAQFKLLDSSYPVMILTQNAINRVKGSQLGNELQSLLDTLEGRLGVVPQLNTVATSLDRFIQYLDNFILQMPALGYELGRISDSLSNLIASPECELVSDNLDEICTQFLAIDTIVKQSRDLEVISRRIWLMDTLADFNLQAKIVQRSIENFCMSNEVVLEEDQSMLEKIQQQLDSLMLHYTKVLETARKLSSELL